MYCFVGHVVPFMLIYSLIGYGIGEWSKSNEHGLHWISRFLYEE